MDEVLNSLLSEVSASGRNTTVKEILPLLGEYFMLSGEKSVNIIMADKGASGIVNINIDLDSQFDSLATTVKCLRIKTNKKIDESISSCQLKNIKLTVEKIDNEGEQLTVTVC